MSLVSGSAGDRAGTVGERGGVAGLSPAAAARAKPVPLWRWTLWFLILAVADLVFYVLMSPLWMGLRAAAWVAELRARRSPRRHD